LEGETEPEKRSKIQALLAGVTSAGREVVVSLGTAWMRQQMGLP
jgi:predicted ATPase